MQSFMKCSLFSNEGLTEEFARARRFRNEHWERSHKHDEKQRKQDQQRRAQRSLKQSNRI